jgi:peptidoglycan/LPS O-acetylase OafA/YrhL
LTAPPDLSPATAGVSSRGRYEHIDALRAVAVMLVVVAHAGLGHVVPGGSGVTIFFAISGFIITHTLLVERERTGGFSISDFYLRRVLKLAPPFLLLILLPTLVWATVRPVDVGAALSQVFFAFNWVYMQGLPDILPGSAVVWSLAIEEQFYIAFALVWLLAFRARRYLTVVTVVAAVTIVVPLVVRLALAAVLPEESLHRRVYYGTDTRIDGIAYGVLAAVLFSLSRAGRLHEGVRRVLASNWVPVLAAAAYLFSLVLRDELFRETFRYSLQAAAAAGLILYGLERSDGRARAVLGRLAGMRWVQVLGLASYSIYLAHLGVILALTPLTEAWPWALAFVLHVAVGTGLGVAVWHFAELPIEAFKKRLMKRRAAERVARVAAEEPAPAVPSTSPA